MSSNNITTILSNFDIRNLSDLYDLNIVCLRQQELKTLKHKNGKKYIINLSKPESNLGHWVALYVMYNDAYYFDSYGVEPSTYIIKFMKKNNLALKEWSNNDIQHITSIACGYYCLAFLIFMEQTKSKNISNFTSLFSNDTKENDNVLQNLLKIWFS